MKPIIVLSIFLSIALFVSCDKTPHEQPKPLEPPVVKPMMAVAYLSERNFVLEGTPSKQLFTYSEALSSVPEGLHLGSRYEWAGIIPPIISLEEPTLLFAAQSEHLGVEEAIQVGNQRATYRSDYKNMGTGLSYALRFAPASSAAEEGFPPAQDKRLLAAYRYQVSSSDTDGGRLTITVRPLGEAFGGTIEEIARESFWTEDSQADIVRTLPFTGEEVDGELLYAGSDGFYWTSTPDGETSAYYVWIGMGAAGIFDDGKQVGNYRAMGHAVRPFLNAPE